MSDEYHYETANSTYIEVDGERLDDVELESVSYDVEDGVTTTCEGPIGAFYKSEDGGIKHRFNEDDGTSDETDEDAAEADVYVYECPRLVTDDEGNTEPCDGAHESTKDYGGHVFRACPECSEDVAMVKV